MKNHMEKQTPNQNPSENLKKKENSTQENNWVFLAIKKDLIAKRTKEYVLVKLAYGYSAIISAKFIRNKESDTHIFASVPYDYKIKVRQTAYDTANKRWVVVDEKTKYAKQVKWDLHVIDEQLKNGQELSSILEYQNLDVDTEEPVPATENLPF